MVVKREPDQFLINENKWKKNGISAIETATINFLSNIYHLEVMFKSSMGSILLYVLYIVVQLTCDKEKLAFSDPN